MKIVSIGSLFLLPLFLIGCLNSGNTVADPNAQLKADTTLISSYVKTNAPKAIKISSGVWYEIDTVGTGYYPTFSDTITFSYVGRELTTGTIFDKSTAPVSFTLASLIGGWQIGLPKLREGSYGRLFIPSSLAYGTSTFSGVGPNANLIFDIKVIKVSGYQTKSDLAKIDKYISDNNITNVINDDSGVRYVINSIGTGNIPSASDVVKVTYTGQVLTSGTPFATISDPTEYRLPDLINAWGIILPKIPTGTKFTMYVPSGLGYSIFSNVQNVPGNSNLIYTVNLISSRH